MAGRAGELEHDVAVPGQPQPGQAVDDGVDGGRGRTLAVGVLDAQQHLAAVAAREQPVEQGGAAASDVEKAGRGRREAYDDTHRRACITNADKIDIEPYVTSWHRPPFAAFHTGFEETWRSLIAQVAKPPNRCAIS